MSVTVLGTAQEHPQLDVMNSSTLFDDFYTYSSGGVWTTDTTNSGTVAAQAVDELLLTTGGSAGNYVGVHSTLANYTFATGIGMFAEALISWTDYSSSSADIIFGFASALVTSSAGAQPTTSYSGAMIQRLSGTSNWACQSSNASAKTFNNCTAGAAGGGTYQLRVNIFNFDSNNAGASYLVNGHPLVDSTTNLQVIHKIPYSSIAAAKVYMTIQTSVADAQTATVDYISASLFRNIQFAAS